MSSAPSGSLGTAGVLLTALLQLRARVDEPARVLQELGRVRRFWRGLSAGMRVLLAYAVAAVAGPLALVVFLVAFVAASLSSNGPAHWALVAACAVVCAVISIWGDLTSWSLHPFYRRRLCTAFALKRVPDGRTAAGRAVERDFDSHPPISEAQPEGWPTLLICAAANVSDPGATPPGRGVTSFTFSAPTRSAARSSARWAWRSTSAARSRAATTSRCPRPSPCRAQRCRPRWAS